MHQSQELLPYFCHSSLAVELHLGVFMGILVVVTGTLHGLKHVWNKRKAASAAHCNNRLCFMTSALQVRLKAIQCMLALLSSKLPSSGTLPSPSLALRNPSRAPLLGFVFSALLKAAEEEVQAGLTGSKALTAAALEAIRYLIQAVDSGDALAFVVPGLASGLSKILIAAGGLFASLFLRLQM